MKRRKNTIVTNRLIIICIFLSFLCIFLKLCFVVLSPTVDGKNLAEFASNRNTVTQTLYATRGNIYDVNGERLAQSVNSYTVIAYLDSRRTTNPKKPQHVVDKARTAKELAPILNMDENRILDLLNQEGLYQVELGPNGRGITEITKSAIEELNLPGIDFIASSKRYYNMGAFAPYIVGYARKNDEGKIVGYMGIESYFNEELTGTDGIHVYQRDASGYQIPNTEATLNLPVAGKDIYLTIDNKIQLFAENTITNIVNSAEVEAVYLSIMDGYTGAILATASSPSFNPNTLDITEYLNPLTSITYEPGSTMKIFSFAAAMEAGIYDGDALYDSGTIKVDDYTIKDFNGVGWGRISYDEGFTHSSNVAATHLALELGADRLTDYYKLLGFGSPTGITLPNEVAGKISMQYRTEIATASFGQGITTTPIQTLQALSFLVNDGVIVKPYIVDKMIDSSTGDVVLQNTRTELRRVASHETTVHVQKIMRETVAAVGRTDAYRYEPSTVHVMGKTGTAQIAENGRYLTGTYDYINSFAGVFPYENPRYIIYVSLKKYHYPNVRPAAEAVADLIAEVAKYKNIETVTPETENTSIIDIPSYLSLNVEEIEEKLKAQKLTPIVIGNGKYIIRQYPTKQKILIGTKVFLYTNGNEIKMPDVTGWSRNEIITFCNLLNLKYTISGYGTVGKINIEPDTIITPDTTLEIILGEIPETNRDSPETNS